MTTTTINQSVGNYADASSLVENDDDIRNKNINHEQLLVDTMVDDDKLVVSKKLSPIARLMSQTWIRVALILGGLIAILLIWWVVHLFNTDAKKVNAGDAGNAGVVIKDPNLIDDKNLSPEQAEHLMQLKQQDAEAKAKAGQTNAATLTLATPTSAQAGMGGASTATTIVDPNSNPDAQARFSTSSDNLSDTKKFMKVGDGASAYYIDNVTKQRIIPRDIHANETPTATTATNSNGNSGSPQSNGGNGSSGNSSGGSNGNGGSNNSTVTTGNNNNNNDQKSKTIPPDPDLPRVEQDLARNYDFYAKQQTALQQQIDSQNQAALAQDRALQQARQTNAQNALANAVARIQGKKSGNFTNLGYYTPSVVTATSNDTNGNANTTVSSLTSALSLPKSDLLASNIIRAGTIWSVVVTRKVNSDATSQVVGRIASGPYAGATVYGSIEPTGRNIGVSFTSIVPVSPRKPVLPINAIALSGVNKAGVASKVDHHYIQNYTMDALLSAIQGYGQAYSQIPQTTTIAPSGTVITTQNEANAQQVRANIYNVLSSRLNNDVGVFANRPVSYIINAGTVLQMVLVDNLDTSASASSINLKRGPATSSVGNAVSRATQ